MKRIETVTKRVIDLKSDFGNPRKISKKNRDDLKESLTKFGDFGLILIDEKDNVIAGNQRVSVIMEQNPETEVLCKRLVGYTKSELKAINIKDNTHSGEWDVDMLADWTADLEIDLGLEKDAEDPTERTIPEIEPIHYEKYDYVMIVCRSELDYNDLVRKLGIEGQKVKIAKRIRNGEIVKTLVITSRFGRHYDNENATENLHQYCKAVTEIGITEPLVLNFPTLEIDVHKQVQVNNAIAEIISQFEPDELFVPHWGDIHAEHKLVCNASLVASRPHRGLVKKVYAYETLSETSLDAPTGSNAFIPTVWESIDNTLGEKLAAMRAFEQQLDSGYKPRSVYAIKALAAYRGTQISTKYAEAFQLIREIVE